MTVRLPEIPKDLQDYDYMMELVRSVERAIDEVDSAANTSLNVQSMSLEKNVVTVDSALGKNSAILVDTSAGNVTVSLPDPSTNYRSVYIVKKITSDANFLYLEARVSGNVEDVPTFGVDDAYGWVGVISDGYDYWVISQGCCGGGGGSASWGGITGVLSNQTDLQTALDAKVSTSAFPELVDDRVAALLIAGANVILTYNDVANTLTIASTGGGGSGNTYFPSGWA